MSPAVAMLSKAKPVEETVGKGGSRKLSGKLAAVESSNQYNKIGSWKTA